MKISNIVSEGDVVQFPKKHRGDISDMHECPKCGGDLQGGKYMGHAVQVCMPCKQVYLPPNSGIDQKGNPIDEMDGDGDGRDGSNRKSHSTYGSRDKHTVSNGPDIHHGPKSMMTSKDMQDRALDTLKKTMSKPENMAVLNRLKTKEGVAEGTDERKQNALWAQITAHEKAAKASKDLKRQHHLKMADQLRSQLKTSDNEQGVAEGASTTWEVSYDYGPHMTKSVTVKARSEEEAAAKVEKDAQRRGFSIMINSVTPAEQGVAEAPGAETLRHNQSTVASNLNSLDLGEGDKKPEQPEADYGDDYQDMVARVKKLAGMGPLKTVYDPAKRVYKNVPTAVQPKK